MRVQFHFFLVSVSLFFGVILINQNRIRGAHLEHMKHISSKFESFNHVNSGLYRGYGKTNIQNNQGSHFNTGPLLCSRHSKSYKNMTSCLTEMGRNSGVNLRNRTKFIIQGVFSYFETFRVINF